MWANTLIPWDVRQKTIGVVVGNSEALNTRLRVLAIKDVEPDPKQSWMIGA